MRTLLCLMLLVVAANARPDYLLSAFGQNVQDVDKRASEACPGNSGSSKLSKADQDAYLNKHNELRSQKQLRELKWDDGLAAQAQKLADQQTTCEMSHELLTCGTTRLGQNLAWSWSSVVQQGTMGGESVVADWYSEVKDYDEGSHSCKPGKVCGHYTQVMWSGTTSVGCAERNCGNEKLAICDYFPAGNVGGRKPF